MPFACGLERPVLLPTREREREREREKIEIERERRERDRASEIERESEYLDAGVPQVELHEVVQVIEDAGRQGLDPIIIKLITRKSSVRHILVNETAAREPSAME